jgi:hypothetical protein
VLIVDVYNVLHVTGVLPAHLAGPGPEGLGDLVAGSRYGTRDAILVCDGTPKPHERGSGRGWDTAVRVVYAGAGKDADSLIERLIAQHTAPRRLLVVSDDRRIRSAARRRRAGWLGSAEFLRQLADDAERPEGKPAPSKPDTLEPGEVDAWLREFGFAPPEESSDGPPTDDLDMQRWLDD